MAEWHLPEEEERKKLTSNNVIRLLRDKDFRFSKYWRRLSQKLGATLEQRQVLEQRTRTNLDSDFSDALEECIDNWLRNSNDPSWVNLIVVIATIDKSTARYMRRYLSISEVAEERTNLECLSDSHLVQLGHLPVDLIPLLEAEGVVTVIDCDWLKNASTWKVVIEGLVSVLKDNRKKEVTFGKLLLHYKETATIGRAIINEDPATPIALSPTYEVKFDSLFCHYATLIDKIRPKILQKLPSSLKDFVRYVKRLPDVNTQVEDCTDFDEVLDIIEELCSYLNVSRFERIALKYNCDEVLKDIKEYTNKIEEFCGNIREGLTSRLPLCVSHIKEPLKCERLEFVLHWDPRQTTFKNIKAILWKAFEDIADEIIVVVVSDGSIEVVCYIPHSLVPLAVYKAKKNLASLEKLGMTKLSIGYITVLEEKLEKEEEREVKEVSLVDEEKSTPEIGTEEALSKELLAVKEQLHDKDEECLQLKENYKGWQSIAQSSSSDQMTSQLLNRLVAHEEKLQFLTQDRTGLVTKNQELQIKLETVKSECQQLSEDIITKSEQLKSVITNSEQREQKLTELIETNVSIQLEIKEVQSQIQEKDSVVTDLNAQMEALTFEMDQLKGESEAHKKKARIRLLENESLSKQQEVHTQQLFSRTPTLHDDWKDIHTPPVQVTMTSFSNYHKNNEHWYSPSFLSHTGGYRMCLRVRARGEGEAKGTHLSVNAHLMVGEFDEYQVWPLRGVVKVELMNRRRNGGNFTSEIVFSDDSNQEASERVFNGIPINTGIMSFMGQGGVKFIPQTSLTYNAQEDIEYLKDDSITLRVVNIQMDFGARVNIPAVPSTSVQSIAEFRITNFTTRKASNAECISDPFYSDPKGYKFVLLVYPNGRGKYKGKNVSAFVHLMKGEYDSQLKFPFRGEIQMQIINTQRDQKHVQKLISFSEETDPDGKYGARATRIGTFFSSGRSFQGYGFPNFVSHDFLKFNQDRDSQYLSDDDSLLVRIVQIKVASSTTTP